MMHRPPLKRLRIALTFVLIVLLTPFATASTPAHAAATFTYDACAYSGSGSTWSSSTGGSNASLVGAPTFSNTSGSYFQLNGTSQYIAIPNSSTVALSTSASRTIQVWMRPTSLPSSGSFPILGKLSGSYGWDGYILSVNSTGTLTSVTNGTGVDRNLASSAGALVAGQWQLITYTSQISSTANTTKVFVNNTNVISGQHGNDSYNESNELRIGGSHFSEYFPSRIGAVYVYDRAVSTSEIADTYSALSNRVSSNGCTQSVPEVSSFTSSQLSPTNDSSLSYSLTFSEAVTGVTSADFSNAGSATGCSFSPGSDTSSATRTVVVSGCGNGTLTPRFAQGGASNASSATGPSSAMNASTTLTLDYTAPTATVTAATITAGTNAIGQSSETGTAYLVHSSITVSSVASITGANGALWNSASITSANTNTSISTSGLDDGNYRLFTVDAAGNLSSASSNVVEIDSAAPNASWSNPSSPTSSRTLSYGLQFSKPVSGISAGDFLITGTASGCSATPSASSTSSSITVTVTCSSDGTVIVALTQNSVVDNASNTGPTSSVTSATVTIAPATTTTTVAPSSSTSTTPAPSSTPAPTNTSTTPTTTAQTRTTSTTTTTIPSRSSSQESTDPTTTTSPSTTAAPTTTSSTTTTSTLPPLALPKSEVGGAAALIGGKQVSAVITRDNNEVSIRVGPLSGRLWGTDATGGKVALDEDGRIRVGKGDSITVELAGFDAGSTTEVRLYSNPVLLGYTEVSASGLLIGSYEIPKDMESGNHRIVFAGTNKGEDVTMSLSVAIGDKGGSTSWLTIFLVIPLLLAIVAGLALPAIVRARKNQ